ncbi:MAG: chemotaxis protein CheC [Thermodesulfobacteriota bacterium]
MDNRSGNSAVPLFSGEEKDILQEVMNIAFGNATADLAELIDIHTVLSVPDVRLIDIDKLTDYLGESIPQNQTNSVAGQKFWGDFNGSGLLFLPSGSERVLSQYFSQSRSDQDDDDCRALDDNIKSGLLLEISNILIGACVGKISDLLNTMVSYTPPELLSLEKTDYSFLLKHFNNEQRAIVMKTLFQFDEQDINGLLLIMTNDQSIDWLKKALHAFISAYED